LVLGRAVHVMKYMWLSRHTCLRAHPGFWLRDQYEYELVPVQL
jgi:hypothetical protein